MNHKLMTRLAVLLVAIIIVVLATEIVLSNRPRETLFLEVWHDVSGKVLKGEPRNIMIDFPSYELKQETGELIGIINFDTNKSHLLILGLGESLSGDAGKGISSHLIAVDSIPYDIEGVHIIEVSGGKVTLEYMGQKINLAPKEKWSSTSESIQSFGESKMKIVETVTIVNHGYVKLKPGNR